MGAQHARAARRHRAPLGSGGSGPGGRAAQRLLRPHAGAVARHQRRVHDGLRAPNRRAGHDQHVARRVVESGARGHRRSGRRRRHPRALARRRRHPPGWADRAGLGAAVPESRGPLHVHRGLRGAQGESERDPRLAGSRAAGRGGRHTQPQDVGKREGDVSCGMGLGRHPRRLPRGRNRVRQAALRARAGPRPRGPRLLGDVRPEADRRRPRHLGERGVPRARRGTRRSRHRLPADELPRRASGRRRRRQRQAQGHRGGGQSLPRLRLQRCRPAHHRRASLPADQARARRASVPRPRALPDHRHRQGLGRRRGPILRRRRPLRPHLRRPRGARAVIDTNRRVLPGFSLSLGYTLLYVGVLVLVPVAAGALRASALTAAELWAAVSTPRAIAAYGLTLGASLVAALIDAALGTLLAWVLVRYRSPLTRLLDALVDIPFALPTAVAGLVYADLYADKGWFGRYLAPLGIRGAYSRLGIVLVLIFVGFPFVVRTLQPVLEDFDPALEEAAACLGASRRQTLALVLAPALLPAIVSGFALAFARALGEYGSVVFIAGNMPFRTEIAPVLIVARLEEFKYGEATAIAMVLVGMSLAALVLIGLLERWSARRHG